jgi:hypothetical protein
MTDFGPEGLDPRLERALRDVLDARDPGTAPRALRDRVDRVPERSAAAASRRSRAGRAAIAVAGLAAALLLVAVLGPLLAARPSGPATSPGPSAVASPQAVPTVPPDVPFTYPEMAVLATESGGRFSAIDPRLALPAIALVVGVVVLGVASLRRVRRARSAAEPAGGAARAMDRLPAPVIGAGWLVVGGAALWLVVVAQPLAAWVSGYGGPLVVTVDGVTRDDGLAVTQVTAPHPGQVSFLEVTVANRGLLPVVVDAPSTWSTAGLPIQPERFATALLPYEEALALPEPPPVLLWPGQMFDARVLYRHVPCETWGVPATPQATPWPTFGPDFKAVVAPDGTPVVVRTDLPLRASVLGLPRDLAPDTGFGFGMAVPTACPPTEPMAAADLSHVPADLAATGSQGVFNPGDEMLGEPASWIIPVSIFLLLVVAIPMALRRRLLAAVVIAAIAVGWGWWLAQPAQLTADTAGLAGMGMADGGEPGVPETYDVGAGGTLTFGFTLRNDGPVPLTLIGVTSSPGQLRLTGLGRPWGTPTTLPEDNLGFLLRTPLDAGSTMQLLGKATAGSCARRLDEPHDAWIHLRAIPWTYDRLGMRSSTLVPLASSVRVPGDAACLASAAMASDGREAWFPVAAPVPAPPVGLVGGMGSWLLLGMAALVTVAWIRQRDRRRAGFALAGAVLLGGWLAFGYVIPVRLTVFATEAAIGTVKGPIDDRIYVNAAPGAAYGFGIGVSVDGLPPPTLTGISNRDSQTPWTGLWTSATPDASLAAPNQPVYTAGQIPWSEVGLWVTGNAQACAVPLPDPGTPPDVATTYMEAPVAVNVEVLGIPRTIELDQRAWPLVPLSTDCLAAEAGG